MFSVVIITAVLYVALYCWIALYQQEVKVN